MTSQDRDSNRGKKLLVLRTREESHSATETLGSRCKGRHRSDRDVTPRDFGVGVSRFKSTKKRDERERKRERREESGRKREKKERKERQKRKKGKSRRKREWRERRER